MNRALTAVTALFLAGSAAAFAGSAENSDDSRHQGAAHESSVDSGERSDQHGEKSEGHEDRDHETQQDSDLGTGQ